MAGFGYASASTWGERVSEGLEGVCEGLSLRRASSLPMVSTAPRQTAEELDYVQRIFDE